MGSGYHVCVGRLGVRDWRVGPAPHALGCHGSVIFDANAVPGLHVQRCVLPEQRRECGRAH